MLPSLDGGHALFDGREVHGRSLVSRVAGHTPSMRTFGSNETGAFTISQDVMRQTAQSLTGQAHKVLILAPATTIDTTPAYAARLSAPIGAAGEMLKHYRTVGLDIFKLPALGVLRDQILATLVDGLTGHLAKLDHRARQLQTASMARIDRYLDERTIAETSKTVGNSGVPIAYELAFDPADIRAGRSYALQARIVVDGKLWFTTTTRHPVFTSEADNPNIIVQRVGGSATISPTAPTGRWLAEDIGGGGVIDRLQTVLEIAADGSISGSGGCNRMTGTATISGNNITFAPIASTKLACTPAAMDQEQKFFAALSRVRNWSIHAGMRKLALLNADGKPLATFAQM